MKAKSDIKILVAEDDYLVCEELLQLLKNQGYNRIEEASDGLEAIDKVRSCDPDLLILDIKMPRMDGLKALQIIRDVTPVPAIMLTAHESSEFVSEANELGISAYLTKPVEAADLDRAIVIALARAKDMKALITANKKLQRALDEIKTLKGLLPMCSFCKNIRDENNNWFSLEQYISDHTNATVSHGVCPECVKKHYPQVR